MNIERTSFTNLVPLTALIEKHVRSPSDLKNYFISGIRKQINFYAVNQAEKYVHMIYWEDIEVDHPPFRTRFYGKEEKFYIFKGNMIPVAKVHQFDKLFKGVLNEIDLFQDINGFHELVEYQQANFPLNLFYEHADDSNLTPPHEFRDVGYQHIFIEAKNLEAVEERISFKQNKKPTKQDLREMVFIEWLKGKDELEVSNMKKDEVWEELRKIDPHLFISESKAFFRRQQIITFKSGRKANQAN
jgi:hypothetical protein